MAPVTILNSVAGPVTPAKIGKRQIGMILSFLLIVLIPTSLTVFYFYTFVHDQYSSQVSFSIRSEDSSTSPFAALSSLGQTSSGTATDASILNEYLDSQKLVKDVSLLIDLKAIYTKPKGDPYFSFDAAKPLEDLVSYFQNMNYVVFDEINGLLNITSFAFDPNDARKIANAIMISSRDLVDHLSRVAQEDTTKLAKFELNQAEKRLFEAQVELNMLRGREQMIDPKANLSSQMGVLAALQKQLANSLVEFDLLIETSQKNDPRITAIKQTIEVIENRILEEKEKIGKLTSNGTRSLAVVVGEFEELLMARDFSEKAYLSAFASYESAQAEARRKSKYLVAHVPPTLAESSQYPNKILWILSVLGSLFLFWTILMLTVNALIDRR
ncbi:hypothetical protein N9P17_04285 [Tateyamaria sp.]|nr:hypothetical protein [Tateyamaria sp.]